MVLFLGVFFLSLHGLLLMNIQEAPSDSEAGQKERAVDLQVTHTEVAVEFIFVDEINQKLRTVK